MEMSAKQRWTTVGIIFLVGLGFNALFAGTPIDSDQFISTVLVTPIVVLVCSILTGSVIVSLVSSISLNAVIPLATQLRGQQWPPDAIVFGIIIATVAGGMVFALLSKFGVFSTIVQILLHRKRVPMSLMKTSVEKPSLYQPNHETWDDSPDPRRMTEIREQSFPARAWFVTGLVVTIVYFVFGIAQLAAERPLFVWSLSTAIIGLIGIIQYTRRRYRATKILWVISGIMGIPLGILLIIAGIKIGKNAT